MPHLVIHDVDAIQRYVFATRRLREIRGASALIDSLNRKDTKRCAKNADGLLKFIYGNGGGAAAIFEDKDSAWAFCQEVSALYPNKTLSASSTGIVQEYTGPEDFGNALKKTHERLQQAKASRSRHTQLLSSPFFKLCDSCGAYPSSHRSPEPDEFICRSCHAKQAFLEDPEKHRVQTYIKNFGKEHYNKGVSFPEELDKIGDKARPQGYIGVIYADGNRIGDLLQDINTPEALEKFSKAIDSAITDSITEALWARYEQMITDHDNLMPVEVPLCGGDDLVAIVPGQDAFEVALDYMKRFQERLEQDYELAEILGGRKVTCCAGVAIAKSHTPLSRLVGLAQDLCKIAKKRNYELFQGSKEEPCLNFQVITAPNWGDPKETFDGPAYKWSDSFTLTARPYTVKEARGLTEAARALKNEHFPASKLHSLYRSLRLGPHKAKLDYLTLYIRAREGDAVKQRTALRKVESLLGVNENQAPWKPRIDGLPGEQTTSYGDLVEIYPFIPQ